MKLHWIIYSLILVATTTVYSQPLEGSGLRITRALPGGTTYTRTDKNGTFVFFPYLYMRKDGKVTLTTRANPFRYSFMPTIVEITINKPFGDSLAGPFSIKGLPGLSLPQGIDTVKKKAALKLNGKLTKGQLKTMSKVIDELANKIQARLNTIQSLQRRLNDLSDQYDRKRALYKEDYRLLYTNLFDRRKAIDEKKFTILDSVSLGTFTRQTFNDFFRPFSASPSLTLASFVEEYGVNRINALKTQVEGPGGLNEIHGQLRDHISTIKVLATSLLEEFGEELTVRDINMLTKLKTTSQETLTSLEKSSTDIQKLQDTVKSTDWPLEFTRFWQTKEEVLQAQFTHYFEKTATGDKMVIRQSFRLMSMQDGKLVANASETDTTFVIKIKGNLHINISGGLGLPFRTDDNYIIKPDGPTSTTTGTITMAKGGLGSPYLVTMFDISWGNYTNINPIISAGIGYPLAGGSLAIFTGGGVAFEIANRRVLFHSGLAYVQSNVLSGGYKLGDTTAKDATIEKATGYRFKPFFAFTYNLGQVK